MAIQTFQLCIVLTIGFSLAAASFDAVAIDTDSLIPNSLDLEDPEDVTVARGHSATLRCRVVSSIKDHRVRWLYNETLIPDNDSRWHVLKNGSLYMPKVAGKRMNNSLEGSYRCLAENANGSIISNPAILKIANMKEFLKQPKDINTTESQAVVIPCSINSTPHTIIEWERDDVPLPQSIRYVPLSTGSLLIPHVHSSDEGIYRCKVSNSILKKTKRSKPGQLRVAPINPNVVVPPSILPIDIVLNVTVLVGNDVTLYCVVNGIPRPNVRWLNDRDVVISNSTVFLLRNVTFSDAGNYTCSGINQGGHIKQIYSLTIQQPPYFNITPQSKLYPTAKTIRLDCQAFGVPAPEILWYKNGQPFHINDTFGRAHEQMSGLLISYSVTSDSGIYQCIATNPHGTIWSSALVQLIFSRNSPSAPLDVHCQSYNDTSVCLQWSSVPNAQAYTIMAYHSGLRLKDYVTNETYKLADNLRTNTNYTFSVRTYSKEASNEFAHVTCKTGSKGKRNLAIQQRGSNSARLTWSEIMSDRNPCSGETATFYKVQWKKSNHSAINVEHVSGLKTIINDLMPGLVYKFRVLATSIKEDNSNWLEFSLKQVDSNFNNNTSKNDVDFPYINETSAVPATPYKLDGAPISSHTINLTWADGNVSDVFYTICYVPVLENIECETGTLIKSLFKSIEIKNLKPNMEYEFRVRAHNAEGLYSPYSISVLIMTPSDVPSCVLGLKSKIINSTSACIRWDPPLYRNGKLVGYLIKYTPNNSWPLEKWFFSKIMLSQRNKGCWNSDTQSLSTLLQNLDPEKQYLVIVVAQNNVGNGNPTKPLTISTKYLPTMDEVQSSAEENNKDNIYYKQGIGVILGISISILLMVLCVVCFLIKRRYMKVQIFSRRRLPIVNKDCGTHSTRIPRVDNCSNDAHEMQHLVEGNGITHIPVGLPTFIDTKGGSEFPNGQVNGNVRKNYLNGNLPNNHVHITENPQFYTNDSIHEPKINADEIMHLNSDHDSYEEDSNSNLQKLCPKKLCRPESPMYIKKTTETQSVKVHDNFDSSLESNLDVSLNSTQLSNLDDSVVTNVLRKISPTIGPNG